MVFFCKRRDNLKHLHLEPVGGVSGDMLLALMVDLGFNPEILSKILFETLGEEIKIEFEDMEFNLLKGKKLKENEIFKKKIISKKNEMLSIIKKIKVEESIKEELIKIYVKLFEEEKKIHKEIDLFLHELGCVDTLLDITGFLIAKKELSIDSFSVGPIPLGEGFVETEHGKLSLPAPLVLNLIKGFIVIPQKGKGETITPTGALILNQFFKPALDSPVMVFEKHGAGFGQQKKENCMNFLKGYLGEVLKKEEIEEVFEIKFNMDDITGQIAGNLMESLMKNGAKDVVFYPITMKKSRPGIAVEVLCYKEDFEKIKEIIFKESPTIGIRYKKMERTVLEREIVKVKTEFGELSLKIGKWKGKPVNAAFEYEELKKISNEKNIPLKEIILRLNSEIYKIIG